MALRKKQENTSAALRAARRRLTASVLTTLLSLALVSAAVFEGVSFGWLALPTREAASDGQGLGSAQFDNATKDGHDTYMFKLNDPTKKDGDGQGVRIGDGAPVTMNTYDKVFPLRNGKTPIILRAVLSPKWKDLAVNGQVDLKLTCGSDKLDRDTNDENNDGIIDYLSNVVVGRVGYIPNLAENAAYGQFDTDLYKDEEDYIYEYATSWLKDDTKPSTQFTFVSAAGTKPTTVTTKGDDVIEYTSVADNEIDENRSKDPEVRDDGATIYSYDFVSNNGFLLSGGGNYIYIDENKNIAVTSDRTTAFEYLWDGDKLKNGQLYCNGKYLCITQEVTTSGWGYSYTYKLSAQNTSADWTISGAAGNISAYQTFEERRNSWGNASNVSVYLKPGSNTWTAAKNNSNNRFTLTAVDTFSTTINKTIDVVVYKKTVTLTVDLGAAKGDDGRYYVYLMLDYDPKLVANYLRDNDLRWSINSTEIEFADNFTIEVTEKQTT